jgi:hypothetical protein
MTKKKKTEEEKQLAEVEFTECDGGQSKREEEMIDLLKQIVTQNEKVIQLIEMLKDRFV